MNNLPENGPPPEGDTFDIGDKITVTVTEVVEEANTLYVELGIDINAYVLAGTDMDPDPIATWHRYPLDCGSRLSTRNRREPVPLGFITTETSCSAG